MPRVTRASQSDQLPRIVCPEASSAITDPWAAPERASRTELARHDGSTPRLRTSVSLWREKGRLEILFDMHDEKAVVAPHLRDDEPLWKHDVVEVFLAPRSLEHYFEIEISPLATRFTASVRSPDLSRSTMDVDLSWESPGLRAFVRRDSGEPFWRTRCRVSLPFADLGHEPAPGETWRVNLYRIDRSERGDEFSAWSPTLTDPPDFHQPARFGYLELS